MHPRILMFAYWFPPLGGVGVQRTLKYVKHLPSEGFAPIVVAARRTQFGVTRDPTLCTEIPAGVVVYRALELPLRRALWTLDGRLRRSGLTHLPLREPWWPDSKMGWLPTAVWHGLRAVRTHRPELLYSTSPPMTGHLAALIVHRLTGLPWVADFRDSWMFDPLGHYDQPPASTRRASAALERTVVNTASRLTVACDSVALMGIGRDDSRRLVIRNGIDPDDFEHLPVEPRPFPDRLRLSYVGSSYGLRSGAPVLAAIRDLIRQGKLDTDRFELRVVGVAEFTGDELESLPVTLTGHVDHRRALTEMASASALLFSKPPQDPGTSGKIFEYLASGRPILCVAHPDNRAFKLVQELGAGICADARDPGAVRLALEQLIANWHQGRLAVPGAVRHEALRRFSRRTLTGEFAGVLREALADGSPAANGTSARCNSGLSPT